MRAGNEPVPAPAKQFATQVANALEPGVNQLTESLMALIPSPPPPPPPPTVITALAPLEEVTNPILTIPHCCAACATILRGMHVGSEQY
jgi:hypothetical protein